MSENTQLMLVVPANGDAEPALGAALERADVACVLIVAQGWQPGSDSSDAPAIDRGNSAALVALAQQHDAAALIANDADLAKELAADGCHLDPSDDVEERYERARRFLGGEASIGVMPGAMRHTAMTLAEAGADYMGFELLGSDDANGTERIRWWTEIFQTPAVAFTAGTKESCMAALEAGPPEFLAVPLASVADPDDLSEIVKLIAELGQLPTVD